MKKYALGIEGGGTKTTYQLRDLQGHVITQGHSGPLNIVGHNEERIKRTIDAIIGGISQVVECDDSMLYIAVSTAGASHKPGKAFIKACFGRSNFRSKIYFVGDHISALYTAFCDEAGIVLISGTGSICIGKDERENIYRVGGWGHVIDDLGSGYAIGRQILSVAVKAWDGRVSGTCLLDQVLHYIQGRSIEDILDYTYGNKANKASIAELAQLLPSALRLGDSLAKEILNKAIDDLSQMIITVAIQLDLKSFKLVMQGGVLHNIHSLRSGVIAVVKESYPDMDYFPNHYNCVQGACYIALQGAKNEEDELWETC